MPDILQHPPSTDLAERVSRLELKLVQLEALVRSHHPAEQPGINAATTGPMADSRPAANLPVTPLGDRREDELEQEVGQNWFARAGVLALAVGGAFLLTLPHPDFPPALPSAIGAAVAVGLFAAAQVLMRSVTVLAVCLRVAAMALLFCAAVRLVHFGATPAFARDSIVARALLLGTVAVNLAIGFRLRSVWLTGLGLITGYAAMIAIGSGGFATGVMVALAAVALFAAVQRQSNALLIGAAALTYATYLAWALLQGAPGRSRLATDPAFAPALLLLCVLAFSAAPLHRPVQFGLGTPLEVVHGLVNCVLGYGVFLLHSLAFAPVFAPAHLAASILFLGLAVLYWKKQQSTVATFFYAMTGYLALSLALLKWSAPPNVFVWLSLESTLVVATAIFFRSRVIVVTNFAIYVGVVAAYMALQQRETGISIGFGIVALVSARLLNWQKHRLALKTELMRNAYLLSAFIVFPYALAHLVAARFVALSWVALAIAYYLLGLFVHNRKYRWLGHGTLVLAGGYALIAGSRNVEPLYRVLSFLAVGLVLTTVSLLFTRSRRRPDTAP